MLVSVPITIVVLTVGSIFFGSFFVLLRTTFVLIFDVAALVAWNGKLILKYSIVYLIATLCFAKAVARLIAIVKVSVLTVSLTIRLICSTLASAQIIPWCLASTVITFWLSWRCFIVTLWQGIEAALTVGLPTVLLRLLSLFHSSLLMLPSTFTVFLIAGKYRWHIKWRPIVPQLPPLLAILTPPFLTTGQIRRLTHTRLLTRGSHWTIPPGLDQKL